MQLNQTIDKLKAYDFLHTILTNLPAVVFVIAPDGTVLFAEGRGIALAGLQRDNLLGANVSTFFSLYPELEEKLRRVLEGETIPSSVIALSQRCLEVTYSPMRDDRGSICGVIGVAQDVTERIEREQALREKESWFRAIFESARDSIFIKDKSLRYVQVSPAMEQLFGLPASELVGKTDEDLFGPEAGAHLREVDARVLDGEVVEEENTKPVNGGPRSFYVIKAPMRDAAGTITGICGIARDITERKEAERELRESEEKFSRAFQANAALMAITDIQTNRFVDVNETFIKVLGFARDEVVGRTAGELELFVDIRRRQAAKSEVEKGKSVRNFEATVRTKSGELRYGIFSAEKIVLQGADCMLTVMVDITERKQAEQALCESESSYRAIFENTGSATVIIEADTVISLVNSEFERLTGWTKEEVESKMSWTQFVVPEDLDMMIARHHLRREDPDAAPATYEFRLSDKNGVIKHVLLNVVMIAGTGKSVASLTDITERKRIEEALRTSENAYRAIFENTGTATMIVEENTTISLVNSEFEKLTGYTKAEVEGKMRWTEFVTAKDVALMLNQHHLRRTDPSAALKSYEFGLQGKDGVVNDVLMTVDIIPGTGQSVASCLDITERKQAEEALRESREVLQAVLNSIPVRVFWKDKNSRFLGCNMPFARDAGFEKPEDIIGKDDRAMGWREQAELYRADDRGVIESGNAKLHIEEPQTTPSGEQIHLLTSKVPLRDISGTIVGVLGTYQDITDRKRTEEELAGSEQKFRTLFENMQEGVALHEVIYDEHEHAINYRILNVNPAYEKHTGISPDIARGKLATDLYGTGSPPYLGRWAKVADTGEPIEFETYFEPMQKHFRISAVSPARGMFATVFLDITEQKRQEAAIRESEEKLRSLFRVAPIGIGLVKDRVILDANERLCQMTGYSRDELLGQSARILYPTQEEFEFVGREKYRQISEHGTGTVETRWQHKNGSICHIVLSSSPLDTSDLSKGDTFTALDITERKRAQEEKERLQQQLQQSQKLEAIGTMAGGIAHDFNNILTGILGFTELVRSEIPEDSEVYENLTEVVNAGRRARDLVKQILSFSRRAETEKSLISLVMVVKDALKLIRSVTPSHISIKQNLTASPAIAILADATQMHQVVLNLCINAGDAMPDGGVLEISLEEVQLETANRPEHKLLPSGCYLKLTVSDNGVGMSPEVRERIFEPYFTTKQVGKGTGMGLAVVHGVVKEHGGSIAVSSDPGKGTAFEICLPIVEAKPDIEIVSSSVVATGSESILFVDDETMITSLQRSQLGKWGYRVTATEDSATALGIFRASPQDFDLVITDQSMPGLTGAKLAQAIHKISPSTPIILCTGFDEGISRENTDKIGIRAILTKPITGAEFSRTIRMVLDEASKPSPAKS